MKFLEFLKNLFIKHVPLKLLSLVFAVLAAIVVGATFSV